jgi:hypothetical protein
MKYWELNGVGTGRTARLLEPRQANHELHIFILNSNGISLGNGTAPA